VVAVSWDQYLPLRVIKDQLAAGDDEDGPRSPGRYPVLAERPVPADRQASSLSRREMLAETGLDETRLAELEEFGLVRRSGRHYGQDALDAARAIVALDHYGVHARHLRVLRAAAERETALIEQVVAPVLQQRSPGARERAGQTAREIASLVLQLHTALIEAGLADAGFTDRGRGQAGA
jgi:hypothetical protein